MNVNEKKKEYFYIGIIVLLLGTILTIIVVENDNRKLNNIKNNNNNNHYQQNDNNIDNDNENNPNYSEPDINNENNYLFNSNGEKENLYTNNKVIDGYVILEDKEVDNQTFNSVEYLYNSFAYRIRGYELGNTMNVFYDIPNDPDPYSDYTTSDDLDDEDKFSFILYQFALRKTFDIDPEEEINVAIPKELVNKYCEKLFGKKTEIKINNKIVIGPYRVFYDGGDMYYLKYNPYGPPFWRFIGYLDNYKEENDTMKLYVKVGYLDPTPNIDGTERIILEDLQNNVILDKIVEDGSKLRQTLDNFQDNEEEIKKSYGDKLSTYEYTFIKKNGSYIFKSVALIK